MSTGDTNFKLSFTQLCKRYGLSYREYLQAAYTAKYDLPDEEFCRLNHCPLANLNKMVTGTKKDPYIQWGVQ